MNPSSGNLHPTEAYIVAGPVAGLADTPAVYHYAADRHLLEQRCAFDASEAWGEPWFLIALTSIHWREAWKYGERAFRYCQHDLGHAIAAVGIAAGLPGWTARLLPDWSHDDIAALTGIDRNEDYFEAEREEPGGILAVTRRESRTVSPRKSRATVIAAARSGRWSGRASRLSEDHVRWTFIDDVAMATRDGGRIVSISDSDAVASPRPLNQLPDHSITRLANLVSPTLLLQRRSAVSLDGMSSTSADQFFTMIGATLPTSSAPWDALWWSPRIHLALFVHRVKGVDPGLYLLPRDASAVDRLKAALRREFLWEPVTTTLPLVRLARGDCRKLAERVSCDQAIAADGFFSLGMIADLDRSLEHFGPSFYRHLFWESGVVGQVLYLQAEAAGCRGTGIGCFYDDAVHDALGITDHTFQSLYHFTIGVPVEDVRLTTEPGYSWEADLRP